MCYTSIMVATYLFLAVPAAILLALGGFLAYDRWVCRPRCWRHGSRPDLDGIGPDVWEAYFHALSNVLETTRRAGWASPFPPTMCAWRLDAFLRSMIRLVRRDLHGQIAPEDFVRCHSAVAYMVRLGFPHALHHSACVTRLREALDQDRLEAPRHARARETLLEHERRLGVTAAMERRFGTPLPQEAAAYSYGLMLRWQALFEEHGFTLHPDLEAWRREKRELGL